jgi:cytochrome c biogenesis protein
LNCKDFQVEYHATGQPKSFTSKVRIHDQEHLGRSAAGRGDRVNHPLVYRGYAIYQSDFGDGGSKLESAGLAVDRRRGWSRWKPRAKSAARSRWVGRLGPLSLELDDFRLFNLLPEPGAQPGDRKFRNFGPSIGFKLRDAAGEAREYLNYMAPGRSLKAAGFSSAGCAPVPALRFSYLHIPVDANNSPERFLRFNARLRDASGCTAVLAPAPLPMAKIPIFSAICIRCG